MVGLRSVLVYIGGANLMLKRLRLVLVLLLAAAVVFANPGTANASTSSGVMLFSFGGVSGFASSLCQLPWAVTSTGLSVGSSSRCDGGANVTPFSCQMFEGDCGSYGLVVRGPQAETCGSTAFSPFTPATGNGATSVASGLGAGFVPLDFVSCEPVEACLSYYLDMPLDEVDVVECVPLDITLPDQPPAPGSTCIHGTPSLTWEWRNMGPWQYGAAYSNWELTFTFSVSGAPVSTAAWAMNVRGNYGRGAGEGLNSTEVVFKRTEGEINAPARPLGVEVYATPDPWNNPVHDADAGLISQTPPTGKGPYMGWTQPAHCRFYFGTPAVTDSSTTEDDPFGDGVTGGVDVPPVEPPVVVEQPDGDPDTDMGLWGAILAVLRTIWSAVSNGLSAVVRAVSGIASAVLGGLEALFVPDTDSWNVQSVRNQARVKPPFSVGSELIDQGQGFASAYQSSGSCGTLGTFSTGTLTCAGIRATPGIGGLYNLVAAGLIALTAFGAFRMLHRTFEAAS